MFVWLQVEYMWTCGACAGVPIALTGVLMMLLLCFASLCLMMLPSLLSFVDCCLAGLVIFGAESALIICSYVPYCFPDVPVSSFVTFDHIPPGCSKWLK